MTQQDLQIRLEVLMGSKNVYFQPPTSIKMKYPAIRYSLNGVSQMRANDGSYRKCYEYNLTLIDEDPDSAFLDDILDLKYCTLNRVYQSDNLNHFNFTLYY